MKKRILVFLLSMLAVFLLAGCAMWTVEDLYCLPKRALKDDNLQAVMNEAMSGLSYCAPLGGENRQPVRYADLDGDGSDEYILLAKDHSDQPLKFIIISRLASGYRRMATIEGYGSDFDFVELANLDDAPGMELIVGRQINEDVSCAVSVYRFSSGTATELVNIRYSKRLIDDLDGDGRAELLLLSPSDSWDRNSKATVYRVDDGQVIADSSLELPCRAARVKRMEQMTLKDGTKTFLVVADENSGISLETFRYADDGLEQLVPTIKISTLQGSSIYPTDMNGDGKIDLPEIRTVPVIVTGYSQEYYISWYNLTAQGEKRIQLYAYHNVADKWYLRLESGWPTGLSVTREKGVTTFKDLKGQLVMSIHALTDSNRQQQAALLEGTTLATGDGVIYVAVFGPAAEDFGMTPVKLKNNFGTTGL